MQSLRPAHWQWQAERAYSAAVSFAAVAMSEPERRPDPSYIPPPPSERAQLIMRVVFSVLGLAVLLGVWFLTRDLATLRRLALSALVAAPFLLTPVLPRDESKPPAGF